GEIIVTESEPRRGFHVVLSGRVKVFKASAEGKEQTVYVFGPGEPFCLCGAFGEEGHLASAAALEASRVLVLPPAGMEKLAAREPALPMAMVSLLSRRLKESLELIESLSLKGLPGRLAAFLLQGAEESGGEAVVRLHLTHRELAKMLNATPEALSRTLKRLADDGLVENRGREIAILDEARLRDAARG
ncbi:MAG: Crp/Fnr family transcriptional regulator, partial [Desulfovibrionaceae bacterium]